MRPPLRRILAPLILLALAWEPAAHGARARFVTLSSEEWPPYFLADPSRPGFAREILTGCIELTTRLEPRFSPLPVEQMYQALRSGTLDGHVFSYRKDREVFVVYGREPLFFDHYRPVVRAGAGVEIDSIADFDALRLGHQRGLRYSEELGDYVDRRRTAGTLVEADDDVALMDLLLRGEIDVFVLLESTARSQIRRRNLAERATVLAYEVSSNDYYFVVSKASKRVEEPREFLDDIDACIRQMKQDGRYAALATRYGLE